jgi:hypothetical protein
MPTISQLPGVVQAVSLADTVVMSQLQTGGSTPGAYVAVQAPLSAIVSAVTASSLPLSGGTLTGPLSVQGSIGAQGSINVTTGNGFQISGANIVAVSNQVTNGAVGPGISQSLFVGLNAGAAFNLLTGENGYSSTGIGTGALQHLTAGNAENVAVGSWAGQYFNGNTGTFVGMHAGGAELSTPAVTYVGCDAGRNSISTGPVTAIGNLALGGGNPNTVTAVGRQAGQGNSAGIIIGGTKTTGDILTVVLSSSASGMSGSPFTLHYTVQSGDNIASIAANIASGLNGALSAPSYGLGTSSSALPDGTAVVVLGFPGSTTNGWALSITATGSVGATETLTVIPGSTLSNSVLIGDAAGQGPALQNATLVSIGGHQSGLHITTDSYLSIWGAQSGGSLMGTAGVSILGAFSAIAAVSITSSTLAGAVVANNLTSTTNGPITIFGSHSGGSLTVPFGNVTVVGSGICQNTLTTGGNVILIGSGGFGVDTPASNTTNYINIENVLTVTGTNTPSTAHTTVSGPLSVSSQATTISSGAGAPTSTQPNGSIYMRTDGAANTRLYVSEGGGTWAAVSTN